MTDAQIRSLVEEVRGRFPAALRADVPEMIDRDVLHVRSTFVPGGTLIDLGGGYSAVSAVLAAMGMQVTVVDTFASTKFYQQFSAQELTDVLRSYGVTLVTGDLRQYDPGEAFGPQTVDAICCFGTIYFFNPRPLLDRCLAVLKPGGRVVVECNNGASLLRRWRVLLGGNNTNTFHEYFVDDLHKRFWVKGDVEALAKYLRLSDYRVIGRNWTVYQSRKGLPASALTLADRGLQFFPGLCNEIYLVGRK